MRQHRRGSARRCRQVIAGAAAVVMTAGCSFFSFDPDVENSEQVEGVGESPMLAALVDSGDLPPLEERLPQEPLVVEPHDEIGQYGGEWNTAILGVHDWPWLGRTVAYENFVRWDPEWEEAVANIATEWEYNDDATELTITIREGIRWSDGEPFTTDDILFALNDIFNNLDVVPHGHLEPGYRGEGRRPHPHDHLRRPRRVVDRGRLPPVPARGEAQALPGTVPHRPQRGRRRTRRGGGVQRLDRDARRQGRCAGLRPVLAKPRHTHHPRVASRGTVGRLRPHGCGTQPLLLEDRSRGQPAALHRPGHLRHPAGRRSHAGPRPQRRDRHARPPLQHPEQPTHPRRQS